MDVARKVVILARECGMQIELEDVNVESLVPEPLESTSSVLDFMDRLPEVRSPSRHKYENFEMKDAFLAGWLGASNTYVAILNDYSLLSRSCSRDCCVTRTSKHTSCSSRSA